jgi:hypothetical protein
MFGAEDAFGNFDFTASSVEGKSMLEAWLSIRSVWPFGGERILLLGSMSSCIIREVLNPVGIIDFSLVCVAEGLSPLAGEPDMFD